MTRLRDRLCNILARATGLRRVLAVARDLDLPDWMVFSGAVYQPVWNVLTERSIDYGLNDYDLAYFDGSDLGWDAEDRVIRRVASAMPPELRDKVEVRNQARVHLWFENHFGEPYAPLRNSAEALTRFVAPAFAVAVRLEANDSVTVFAPFGLEDLFDMRLRPTTHHSALGFAAAVAKARVRWPEAVVET